MTARRAFLLALAVTLGAHTGHAAWSWTAERAHLPKRKSTNCSRLPRPGAPVPPPLGPNRSLDNLPGRRPGC